MKDWISAELSSVDLKDERLNNRFCRILGSLSEQSSASLPVSLKGHSELTAAYRFFSNTRVNFENVLKPHVEKTLKRFSCQDIVLLIGDTTEIANKRPSRNMKGDGYLDSTRRGTLLHVLVGFTDNGVALGSVSAELINRGKGNISLVK